MGMIYTRPRKEQPKSVEARHLHFTQGLYQPEDTDKEPTLNMAHGSPCIYVSGRSTDLETDNQMLNHFAQYGICNLAGVRDTHPQHMHYF
eukprot:123932-Pelagomonas_calceolata.AAC.2